MARPLEINELRSVGHSAGFGVTGSKVVIYHSASYMEVLTGRGQANIAAATKMDAFNLGNEELTILGKVAMALNRKAVGVKESLI